MVDKTVEIDGELFPVYATVEDADAYMKGVFSNETWFDLTTDDEMKARLLITATRIFDRQCWLGESAALSGQQLAWPRTGITDVAEDQVPVNIQYGCIELANLILTGSDVESNVQPGVQTIQSLRAGSVGMTFFRDAENPYTKAARFPTVVQELVGRYLANAGTVVTGVATGTSDSSNPDTLSVTNQKYGFNTGL